jgi:hypothetical protein
MSRPVTSTPWFFPDPVGIVATLRGTNPLEIIHSLDSDNATNDFRSTDRLTEAHASSSAVDRR